MEIHLIEISSTLKHTCAFVYKCVYVNSFGENAYCFMCILNYVQTMWSGDTI